MNDEQKQAVVEYFQKQPGSVTIESPVQYFTEEKSDSDRKRNTDKKGNADEYRTPRRPFTKDFRKEIIDAVRTIVAEGIVVKVQTKNGGIKYRKATKKR